MNRLPGCVCLQIPLLSLLWLVVMVVPGFALQPDEVLILANRRVAEGVELAHHYARSRNIPDENLLLLDVPNRETCGRDVYQRHIAEPVRQYLAGIVPAWRIRCLVVMYGLPLKVAAGQEADRETIQVLEARKAALMALQQKSAKPPANEDGAAELAEIRRRLNAERLRVDGLASLESELAVVRDADAPVGGWLENPFCIAFKGHPTTLSKETVIMTARLDGPTPASVRRMIDDAIRIESIGLSGVAYFDARWPDSDANQPSAYRQYDLAIHRAAAAVERSGRMRVVLDAEQRLFQPGDCPRAALYCGWYSLKRYVDAFGWQAGSVGYHIASGECTTLKREGAQVWCKRMLEEGVCATIGPVGEPYVQAFPMPDLFFGLLTEGVLSLAECYMVSLPYLSWKMVLLGDPLYHPFKNAQSRRGE